MRIHEWMFLWCGRAELQQSFPVPNEGVVRAVTPAWGSREPGAFLPVGIHQTWMKKALNCPFFFFFYFILPAGKDLVALTCDTILNQGLTKWPVDILCLPNYSVILWIQEARSAGKLPSIPVLLFSLSGFSWSILLHTGCFSLSTSIMSNTMYVWHLDQTQGAAAALTFLWKTKEFLSSCTDLDWSH